MVSTTVLVLIELTNFAVALRLRCGSCKNTFLTLFHHFLLNLRTLCILWSLVTRRLTRLQTKYNVLKFSKKWWNNVDKSNLQEPQRNRNATANFVNLIMTSTVPAESPQSKVDLQKLLYKLLFRTLTSKYFDQPSPNFIQMLKII